MNLFKSLDEEADFDSMVERFPVGKYKAWFVKLKQYCQFITRCYEETKEENEALRSINADLTAQLADANATQSNRTP